MRLGFWPNLLGAAGIFVVALAADQLTKYYLPTVFINTGLAFGVPEPYGWPFYIVVFFIVGFGAYLLKPLPSTPLALVAAGAVGNIVDRIMAGGVRDMWQVGNLYFNVADLLVVGGLAALVWLLWRRQATASAEGG